MNLIQNQILELLKKNARYSNVDISNMLNVSESVVETEIQGLIEHGIIRQFTTIINDNNIDDYPIRALVELSIRPEKGTGYDAIAQRIFSYDNVISHYLVSGKYDFLLVVEGSDHKDIAHFVFDKLATLENVKSTTTHFIFKSYKEHGVLMEEAATSSRLAILP